MRSIALLSSGLDSAVAFKMTYDITGVELAITFDYGQRAAKKEVERAKAICDRFHVRHEIIKLPWLKAITATALVNKKAAVPTPAAADLDDIKGKALETAHLVWVPNRNGAFINIAPPTPTRSRSTRSYAASTRRKAPRSRTTRRHS